MIFTVTFFIENFLLGFFGLLEIASFLPYYFILFTCRTLLWHVLYPLFYVFKTFICHVRHGRRDLQTEGNFCVQCLGCKLHVCKQELALLGRFRKGTASDTSSHNPLDPESAFVDHCSQVVTVLHPVRSPGGGDCFHPGDAWNMITASIGQKRVAINLSIEITFLTRFFII